MTMCVYLCQSFFHIFYLFISLFLRPLPLSVFLWSFWSNGFVLTWRAGVWNAARWKQPWWVYACKRESETALSIYILLIQLVSVSVGENLHREKCVFVCVCVCVRESKDKKSWVSLPLPGDSFLFLLLHVDTQIKEKLYCPHIFSVRLFSVLLPKYWHIHQQNKVFLKPFFLFSCWVIIGRIKKNQIREA